MCTRKECLPAKWASLLVWSHESKGVHINILWWSQECSCILRVGCFFYWNLWLFDPSATYFSLKYKSATINLEILNVIQLSSLVDLSFVSCNWQKVLQWGSETFEFRTFWGSDVKWSGICHVHSFSPNHSKTRPFKIRTFFVQISNGFWQNGAHLSRFHMAGLLDFRSHSKSGPFATQSHFGHSKSRLVWISDHQCI